VSFCYRNSVTFQFEITAGYVFKFKKCFIICGQGLPGPPGAEGRIDLEQLRPIIADIVRELLPAGKPGKMRM